jgi:hypothetical protein
MLRTFRAINNHPSLYFNRFIKFFSWSLFFLMPAYASILWPFFRKTRRYYYGHLIFSVNQHAFTFIFFSLMLVIKLLFPDRNYHPENYLLLLIPIYMIIGTSQFYREKWWNTFLKWIGATTFYNFLLLVSVGFIFYFWFKNEFM